MRRHRFITSASAGIAILFAGCMSGPDYQKPELDLPDTWTQSVPATESETAADLASWWTVFDDPQLTGLVELAQEENLDLKTAVARIDEALALRGIARGALLPGIDGKGSVLSTRVSDASGGAALPDRTFELYSIGVDASWEIDVWGRVRRSVQAAGAGLQASVEDYRNTLVILNAQIASTYLSIREAQLRIRLAEQNIDFQKDTLRLTEGRYDAGLVPALDVHQARLNLSRTEATLPQLRQQLTASIHRLSVLTGQAPGALNDQLAVAASVPHPSPEILRDIPAEVMRQRPDVRAAEQRLIAQTARIGVAAADLYPRFSLSGSFAFEATESGDLGSSESLGYGFGPTFRWALFQGGRVRANIRAEEARADQALHQYRQTVLTALEDVENAMSAYREESIRAARLGEGVVSAEKAVDQVRSLYENGLVTFLNVLDAERNLATQQDNHAASLGQQSRNLVSLYRALGGGWTADADTDAD